MTYGGVANCAELTEQAIYRLAQAKQIPTLKAGNSCSPNSKTSIAGLAAKH